MYIYRQNARKRQEKKSERQKGKGRQYSQREPPLLRGSLRVSASAHTPPPTFFLGRGRGRCVSLSAFPPSRFSRLYPSVLFSPAPPPRCPFVFLFLHRGQLTHFMSPAAFSPATPTPLFPLPPPSQEATPADVEGRKRGSVRHM